MAAAAAAPSALPFFCAAPPSPVHRLLIETPRSASAQPAAAHGRGWAVGNRQSFSRPSAALGGRRPCDRFRLERPVASRVRTDERATARRGAGEHPPGPSNSIRTITRDRQASHLGCAPAVKSGSSNTISPSTIVRRLLVVGNIRDGTVRTSCDITVRSAAMPTFTRPFVSSWRSA